MTDKEIETLKNDQKHIDITEDIPKDQHNIA
jgi:hypothetical protein